MDATLFVYPCRLTADADGRLLVTFPDLPEAATDGANEAEAMAEAADCLTSALAFRLKHKETVPVPSPVKRGQRQVAPDPTVALKMALHRIAAERGMSAADIARRLGISHPEARRLFDPFYRSKIDKLSNALATLGHVVTIAVYDTSTGEQLLTKPTKRSGEAGPTRLDRATRIAPASS
jgi:antitoxin HicB